MKKTTSSIICAVALAAMTAACSGGHQYNISGEIDDAQFEGQMAYLFNGSERVDSAMIVDGHFEMKGNVDAAWVGTLMARGETMRAQSVCIIEPGNIAVDMLNDHMSGTPNNDTLQQFVAATARIAQEFEPEMRIYEQQYYSATSAESRAVAERLYDSVEAICTDRTFDYASAFFARHKGDATGAYALNVAAQTDRMTYSQLTAATADAAQVVKDYYPLQAKIDQLRAIEQTSAGNHYTDVQGVDGKLSDLIDGKLALVDFYASWCGPCRAEIRDNLVPLWAKYKDKGLVIVGLNVWERGDRAAREAAHQKVMADLGITYPQLVDSTRNATNTYGVQGIPQIMLIGRDGTILARDLRGDAIEEAIIKAL